jgi:hypothetical protein
LRQDALQTTFSVFLDIFCSPNFRCFEENGVFQHPRDIAPVDDQERGFRISLGVTSRIRAPPQALRTETLSASRLGQDFEHGAVVMSTALIRYAVEMPSFIGKEAAVGSESVPTVVVEDMQLLLRPASPSLGL